MGSPFSFLRPPDLPSDATPESLAFGRHLEAGRWLERQERIGGLTARGAGTRLTTGAEFEVVLAIQPSGTPRGRWQPAENEAEIAPSYSIKLTLAWETCCRSGPPIPLPAAEIQTDPKQALGAAILFSYPEVATLAGVQGVIVYAFASSMPMLVFGALGPIIRRKCPDGFVLTEWTRQRYGTLAMLYLSFMTLVTLFLYMVAELSALGQVIGALTGLDKLPVIIVQCAVTTVYTCKSLFAAYRCGRMLIDGCAVA